MAKTNTRKVRLRTLSATVDGVFPPGSEVTVAGDQADWLVSSGQATEVGEAAAASETESASQAEPESAEAFPRHKGAGWYELSDGSTVRGEDEAVEAEAALQGAS